MSMIPIAVIILNPELDICCFWHGIRSVHQSTRMGHGSRRRTAT